MTNPDSLQRAQDEYFRLKGQLATGRITPEQFNTALNALSFQDAQGRRWKLGADDGKWYVLQGTQWVEGVPPQGQPVIPSSLPERGASPSAPPPAGMPSAPKSQSSNKLPFILIGALVIVALGAAAFLFLNNSNRGEQNVALQATSTAAGNPSATSAPQATASNLVSPTLPPVPSSTPTALVPTATPALASSNVPGVQVAVVAAPSPSPITVQDFAALNTELAEKINALNQAELKFIRDARQSSRLTRPGGYAFPAALQNTALLDRDLKELASKAMDVAIAAGELNALAAKQDNGGAQAAQSAEAYANIARNAYSLVIDSQNMRQGLLNNLIPGAQGIELVAQYGAELWNSESTDGTTGGNPFLALAKNAEPPLVLKSSAAAPVQAALNGAFGSIWIAQSGTQTTKTVNVPAAQAPVGNPFDPQTLQALTTTDGQNDAGKAQQVAGSNLVRLGGTASSTDFSKPTKLQVSVSPVAVAEGGQIKSGDLPTFPTGKAVVAAKNSSGDENPFLQSFGLNGEQPPTDQGKTPVQDAPPLVNVNISNIVVSQVNKRPKDASNTFEADVVYTFDVQWQSNLAAPQFELDCVSGNHFDIKSAAGTQHISAKGLLILYPGTEDAFCYASHNGNTWGSASVHFLLGDPAQATVRAQQVETDAVALDATLTADAHGTESAEQTQAAATVQVVATQHALETEVAGTETVEFKQTADAFGTKQALPPPATAEPTATPTFTPKVVDQVAHPGNIFAVSTNVVLERGHLYRFTFSGQINLINPTRSVSASDLPEHVNGVTVPGNGIVVVEGIGSVATISCGSGEPDPDNPGAFGITVEDLGPM